MEFKNRKEALLELFKLASEEKGIGGVVLYVKHKEYPQPEIIIIHKANFELKVKYIEKAYTDDLKLSNCEDIEIVGVSVTDITGEEIV